MAYQKKSYKKFVATAATATLVASAIVPVASASFTDVAENNEFAAYINTAVEAGYVKGYADGTFGVNDNLKRSQVVIIIGRYLEKLGYTSEKTTSPWSDVTSEEVIKYGNIVKDAGVFTGYADGTLKGNDFITRENMAVVLDRVAKTVTGTSLSELAEYIEDIEVADLATANAAYQESIQALRDLEISTADNFNPKGNLKRGQFAKFIVLAEAAIDAIAEEPTVESVTAVNKTTVEVKLNTVVDAVKAENFTIEGATVTAATLGEDKKTVTLTVSGLAYNKEYTVAVKDIEVNGEKTDFGTAKFTSKGIKDLWTLAISTKDASLKADGADNTEVTFKLLDAKGQVDVNADNVVLDLNTTFGTLAQKRVTIQDGVATVLLTSEFSNQNVTAKIDAQIIEASGDYKELIGQVVGTTTIPFVTTNVENVNTVSIIAAEANQTDRVTLFFDKEVTLKHFVQTNDNGELLYTVAGLNGKYTADSDEVKDAAPEKIAHALRADAVTIAQKVNPNPNPEFKVKGIKVLPNTKAIEIILDKKGALLHDNADVNVTVNTINSVKKVTKSDVDFKVTDARVPSATSVVAEGLNTLKVKFSEAIDTTTLVIDGRHEGEKVDNVSDITAEKLAASTGKFVYAFGDFNPATQEDNRDLATVKLTANYKENFQGAVGGYFGAGQHTVQASSTKDFAWDTDRNNIGTTQNLTFNIVADTARPTATVTVESPEQFRVKFDKSTNLTAASFKALFTNQAALAKVQVYDAESKDYADVTSTDKLNPKYLEFTKVSDSEFVIELNTDWTQIYNTLGTTKNYYNDKYRLVIAKDQVTNVANGLKNAQIVLDLNYTGSPLNQADVTSPKINQIDRVGSTAKFKVTMSEPVKLVIKDVQQDKAETRTDGLFTTAQTQNAQATTTVQFLGTDKDGNAVTFDGVVNGYADTKTAEDKVLDVQWTTKYFAVDATTGKQTVATAAQATTTAADGTVKVNAGYIAVTPQDIVDQGGKAEWTIVVRAIGDDVGNTAASETKVFTIEKSKAAVTPFFVDKTADNKYRVEGKSNGTSEDTVEIIFSEGVQWTGIHDATNPAQYTLNGKTLPEGTRITVDTKDDATHATAAGYEKVTITLPDGTLNTPKDDKSIASNVITVNKNLTSYDGSVIEGATEISFVTDGTVAPEKTSQELVKEEADKITSSPSIGADNKLVLPTVAAGYTVAIKSSSNEAVISLDGTVVPAATEQTVDVELIVTNSKGETAVTKKLTVKVPAKQTGETKVTLKELNYTVNDIPFTSNKGIIVKASTLPTQLQGKTLTITVDGKEYTFVPNNTTPDNLQIILPKVAFDQVKFDAAEVTAK